MALNALLKFTQGATVGGDGEALEVVASTQVNVKAANTVDVSSWTIELLYAPPGSGMEVDPGSPALVASGGAGDPPSYDFIPQPNAPGCYRFRLRFTSNTGVVDTDIRNVGVAAPNGLIPPPYQDRPAVLPLEGPGAKPNELNFGGQPFGWAGRNGDKLLHDAVKLIATGSTSPGFEIVQSAEFVADPVVPPPSAWTTILSLLPPDESFDSIELVISMSALQSFALGGRAEHRILMPRNDAIGGNVGSPTVGTSYLIGSIATGNDYQFVQGGPVGVTPLELQVRNNRSQMNPLLFTARAVIHRKALP